MKEKESVEMPDKNGIIQVGVVVRDLQESLDFYTNVIGMKEVREFSVDSAFGERSGLSRGVPFDVKVLQLQESEYATNWKLMTFKEQGEPAAKDNIQDGIGMQYITINVKSLQPFIARMKEHGVDALGVTPIELSAGRHFILLKDPNGIFVELIGPLEQR